MYGNENKPINLKDLSKPLLEEDEEEFKLPEADVTPDGADNSSSDSDNKDDKSDDKIMIQNQMIINQNQLMKRSRRNVP